jgi:hypothetical protein
MTRLGSPTAAMFSTAPLATVSANRQSRAMQVEDFRRWRYRGSGGSTEIEAPDALLRREARSALLIAVSAVVAVEIAWVVVFAVSID